MEITKHSETLNYIYRKLAYARHLYYGVSYRYHLEINEMRRNQII